MKEERFEKVLYMIKKTIGDYIVFDRDIEEWYEPIDKDNVYEEQDELYRWLYDKGYEFCWDEDEGAYICEFNYKEEERC